MDRLIIAGFVLLLLVAGCSKTDESPQETAEDTVSVEEPLAEDTTLADTSGDRPAGDSVDEQTKSTAAEDNSFSWDGPQLVFFRDSTVMPLSEKTRGVRRKQGGQAQPVGSGRYAVYPESSSPKIFVVDSVEKRTRVVRQGPDTTYEYVVGRGHFLESPATGSVAPRIRVGADGPLAFRVSADVEDPHDRVPARDTTLTAAQREAVGEHVANQLMDHERGYGPLWDSTSMNAGPSERRLLKQTAVAQLDPAVEGDDAIDIAVGDTSSLAVDVPALDVEGTDASRHLIVATRVDADLIDVRREGEGIQEYSLYHAGTTPPTRITADSAQSTLGLNADSVKTAYYQKKRQTAVIIGRLSADAWDEEGAKVNTSRHRKSLQVLDANGDGMPEFLFTSGLIGGVRYRVFAYREGTFKRL